MQKKRRIELIVLSVISLFIIAACGQEEVIGGKASPFLGGSEGLVIEFLPGSPPEAVTDGGVFPFEAVLRLKNSGEHNLGTDDVKIDLIGFVPEKFNLVGTDKDLLKNKAPESSPTARRKDSEGNIIEATETFVTFPSTSKKFNFIGAVKGNTPFVFRAEVCYKYQTEAVSELCVLENMIDVADNAVCDPSESKSVSSSASPIHISAFRQVVAGENKIQFSFDIVHQGNGDIFKESDFTDDTIDNCPKSPSKRRPNEDQVKVTVNTGLPAITSGTAPLICNGLISADHKTGSSNSSGFVKLVNGKRTVTCVQDLSPTRTDFKRRVDITLDFSYFDSVQKNVLVKHLVGSEPVDLPPVSGGGDAADGDGVTDEEPQPQVCGTNTNGECMASKPAATCSEDESEKVDWFDTGEECSGDLTCYERRGVECLGGCSNNVCASAISPFSFIAHNNGDIRLILNTQEDSLCKVRYISVETEITEGNFDTKRGCENLDDNNYPTSELTKKHRCKIPSANVENVNEDVNFVFGKRKEVGCKNAQGAFEKIRLYTIDVARDSGVVTALSVVELPVDLDQSIELIKEDLPEFRITVIKGPNVKGRDEGIDSNFIWETDRESTCKTHPDNLPYDDVNIGLIADTSKGIRHTTDQVSTSGKEGTKRFIICRDRDNNDKSFRFTIDTTQPNAISNLAVTPEKVGDKYRMTLEWNKPSDVHSEILKYHVRVRDDQEIDIFNWGTSTKMEGDAYNDPPEPSAGRTQETYITKGVFEPASTYYFAVKAEDDVGNIAILSNVIQVDTEE